MKARIFKTLFMLGLAGMMTGCVTTAQRRADLEEISARGVDATVYARVEARRSLSVEDIAHLTSKGVPEILITKHIRWKQDIYTLQAADIDRLREAKASEELINFLLSTASLYGNAFPPYYWGRAAFCPPFYFHSYHYGYSYPYYAPGLRYGPR